MLRDSLWWFRVFEHYVLEIDRLNLKDFLTF